MRGGEKERKKRRGERGRDGIEVRVGEWRGRGGEGRGGEERGGKGRGGERGERMRGEDGVRREQSRAGRGGRRGKDDNWVSVDVLVEWEEMVPGI